MYPNFLLSEMGSFSSLLEMEKTGHEAANCMNQQSTNQGSNEQTLLQPSFQNVDSQLGLYLSPHSISR